MASMINGNLLCLCLSTKKVTITNIATSKTMVAPAAVAPAMIGILSLIADMSPGGVTVTDWNADPKR